MQRIELNTVGRQLFVRRVVQGGVYTALKLFPGATRAGEHVFHRFDVTRLSRVARTQQRDLRQGVSEALDAAACRQGQRLQRLQRAAGGRKIVRITGSELEPPFCIDYGDKKIYLGSDPGNSLLEYATVTLFISPWMADDVTVGDLSYSEFASVGGGMSGGAGWLIDQRYLR